MGHETARELRQDVVLGVGFVGLAIATLRRLLVVTGQRASETVITTFYSLVLFTSVVRAVWFLIPTSVYEPTYAPSAQYAFKGHWAGTYMSQVLLYVGSLSLFSVFILMAIFWADLLKKIFKDSVRPSRPMASFTTVAAGLAAAEGLNSCLFFARVYSSQGMVLFESALLCLLSLVCSVEISRFSHRFRTVLRTLGAVNQISTEAQVSRIVKITVTGNVFFAIRGACELTMAMSIYIYYKHHKSFDIVFNAGMYDWYVVIKHASEWLILFLMLWILHNPDDASNRGAGGGDEIGDEGGAVGGAEKYWAADDEENRYNDNNPEAQLTGNGRTVDEYGAI